ncbi:hypothetical protein, partial [Klebsiella pneumoniae]|uniref:hypothetical protein n=1 Tax=Klebsiella pneumoniae TaxID=573 RepID=UPI0021A42977
KRAYCLKTQPATGETYPKSDLFNKAYGIGNFAFNSSKTMLERSACEVVTDIYHKQLRQYSQQCENVTLTESEGKRHYGFAQISDGTTKDITVTEQSDGKIVVYIE